MTYCISSDLRHFDIKNGSEYIGKVHDLYFDDEEWNIKWFVIETGHWFSSNKVLMDCQHTIEVSPARGFIDVSLTREQIENAPAASEHPPVSEQRSTEHRYMAGTYSALQFPGYAEVMMPLTLIERPVSTTRAEQKIDEIRKERVEKHLRSAHELEGYVISASDGELGPLTDMVINTEQWTIELLALDTTKWLVDRTVVISPRSIDRVSWQDRKLMVTMNKETIEASPELRSLRSIETSYVSDLNEFYRFPMVY